MEGNPRPRRKRRIPELESDSESCSSESDMDVRPPRRNRSRQIVDSESQSDSSIEVTRKKRVHRPMLISESDDSSSSDSDIVRRPKGPHRIDSSDYESDWSTNSTKAGESSKTAPPGQEAGSSSDSDGQSDKCPICLLTFKTQEVGSPEACDHSFCVECIQEWSKNVNTCPVDRQPFNLILVRSHYNGKVVRQVAVAPAQQQNLDNIVFDDPTYCEVCGDCDREERMLLCDGCDLGYHLECLTPPLSEVPPGLWYCSSCGPHRDGQVDDFAIYLQQQRRVTRMSTIRLVPRTQQTERVRTTIMTNRVQRNQLNDGEIEVRVGSSSNAQGSRKKRRKYKRRRTTKSKIKITYAIDEETGQKIVIETKGRKSRRRGRRRTRVTARRAAQQPKTVKKRLAVQLGICTPRSSGQTLPDVRVSVEGNRIGVQRSQAGIPALNIFGTRDQLDYFSGSDADNENEGDGVGVGLLRARRPNLSDAAIFRRNANRKSVLLSTPSTSSCDLLGSILDSQEKFHSKNAVLSVTKDGSIKVDTKKKSNDSINNNNERVNLNNPGNFRVRHAPTSNASEPPSNSTINNSTGEYRNAVNTVTSNTVTTTSTGNSVSTSSGGDGDCPMEPTQNSSINTSCGDDVEPSKKSGANSPKSDSELDIYSDIETVSTSKADETKAPSPPPEAPLNIQSDDEANNSDTDLIIDTEKVEEKPVQPEEEQREESKEEDVTSTTNVCPPIDEPQEERSCDEDADSEDGCPNFSIYSAESIKLAKTTDLELLNQEANVGSSLDVAQPEKPVENDPLEQENAVSMEDLIPEEPCSPETHEEEEQRVEDENLKEPLSSSEIDENQSPTKVDEEVEKPAEDPSEKPVEKKKEKLKKLSDPTVLYSDSDDEVAKVEPFNIGDIRSMTEDISEEERSYTPCLDERQPVREGLDGLDTEAISDEEKNDFDEAQEQEMKTASDGGDALEINAKECELDFSKPEEYEEGEIVDKLKKLEEAKKAETNNNVEQLETPSTEKDVTTSNKEKESPAFKKISKSNKDRNYRDKDKENGEKSPEKDNKVESQKKKERKKEKRKEIERYNVRTVVAEKPRRIKDKFGRDYRRRSLSRSSRSTSPPHRSPSRGRRSYSRDKNRKRRGRSNSRSRSRKPSRSRNRRRTVSRGRKRNRRSISRTKGRKKNRSLSRHRTRSVTPKRRKDWERRWSPSPSRSRSPLTPSWTPPRLLEKQPVKPHNLTVILTNDSNKKKKDKKRGDKKKRDGDKQKKRKRDKTPPPSKEVFASGDNILVSVSFNDEREREATIKRKRDDDLTTKRTRKEKERLRRERSPRTKKKNKELAGIKPVAIIDLDRSPFKELTPSPKDIIVLSDSENGETREEIVCDSSQQPDYTTGPKTPPEPQVKFSLNAKAPQLRAINNPLHEPDDLDAEMDPQEELEARLADTLHKGPNTPPEPPNSPPSSPDAYDPFDPTKSRSPTPENTSNVQSCLAQSSDNNLNEVADTLEKTGAQLAQTPDISHTPPVVTDIQPADSQSNASTNTPDHNSKQTPERNIGVVINQVVQSQPSIFPQSNKPGAQPAYSSSASTTTTATPNLNSRINILNTTILQPVIPSIPQRIVLPTTTKSSPIKVAPTKPTIKSTPIKPMPNKNISKAAARKTNNRNDSNISTVDLDSPYSPGPSDYEDLFEPPSESISKTKSKPSKSGGTGKSTGTFDALFGSSPRMTKNKQDKKKKTPSKGTKMVGVKVDEDSLKILDDLPNSAVEMQVKDKFLKKLNRQERVVEEVKLVLKPHYNKKHINKEDYKDILRRAVPKICHNKSGEINPKKIQNLVEAYVKKVRHSKKVTSSSSVNPQK